MEDFKKLFFDEASDLLIKLEESLMHLEDNPDDIELINEVFRIMHSLKGSGSMFGFDNLSKLTHDLETLYDKIRTGDIKLTSDIISFTMSTNDHISQLLKNDSDESLVLRTDEIKKHINSIITSGSTESIDEESNNTEITDNKSRNSVSNSNEATYFIRFIPNEDILSDGTNPIYLVDELADLGESIVRLNIDNIPDFEEIEYEKCKVSWTIILSTEVDKSEIDDVFLFVEDDSKIEIVKISEKNLLSNFNSKSTFEFVLNNKENTLENVLSAVKSLETMLDDRSVIDELTAVESRVVSENIVDEFESVTSVGTKTESAGIETVKVAANKLDSLINLVSELVTTQARLVNMAAETRSTEMVILSEDLQHLSRQFRDIAFDMRLIPVQTMVIKFKRLVRDLSKNLGKKVNFTTEGTETELDKNIITTISDPIMHIIRNSIDHGIELPETRLENNKPEAGNIHLKAYHSGTSIVINIKDDGNGIDKNAVLKKAIDRNLILPTDELSDKEIYNLLMLPGFTTSELVTDVSGRGVGMDVVRKTIEDLRGEVMIDSKPGQGSEITIRLPLTLSIIDGLLVTINNDSFVIPLSSVKQIYKVDKESVNNSINNILNVEGVQFPFLNLPKLFGSISNETDEIHFVTVSYKDKSIGLVINKLISEYQAVLKPIGKILKNNEIFAGATILGDGKVALVLDTNKLIDHYSNQKLM